MKQLQPVIASKDIERLASDVYNLLKEQGLNRQQFIQFSSELLGQVIENLQMHSDGPDLAAT